MRCEDLIRELATPTGTLPSEAMADHLSSCHRCAERSNSSVRLDRIWEATRLPEPSSSDLDALWARASASLDAPKPAVIPFAAPARRGRWGVAALYLAQAAVLLIAATILFRPGPAPVVDLAQGEKPVPPPAVTTPPSRITSYVDQTMIVRLYEQEGPQFEYLDDSELFAGSLMADSTPQDAFNALESMASQ
ncbi:hypothetical protein P12x_002841 [Tundrisphaera lichenicola]|uniref:hypothetical protein n=1 Tax=Tundrisphaera lichenicola TaxID=2029860 RepID=UPI003EBEB67E